MHPLLMEAVSLSGPRTGGVGRSWEGQCSGTSNLGLGLSAFPVSFARALGVDRRPGTPGNVSPWARTAVTSSSVGRGGVGGASRGLETIDTKHWTVKVADHPWSRENEALTQSHTAVLAGRAGTWVC